MCFCRRQQGRFCIWRCISKAAASRGRFPAAERAAFAALRTGGVAGRDARDQLVRHNLRLVAHVCKKYYAATSNQDDLISIGTIGLIKAVDTFDPARASALPATRAGASRTSYEWS